MTKSQTRVCSWCMVFCVCVCLCKSGRSTVSMGFIRGYPNNCRCQCVCSQQVKATLLFGSVILPTLFSLSFFFLLSIDDCLILRSEVDQRHEACVHIDHSDASLGHLNYPAHACLWSTFLCGSFLQLVTLSVHNIAHQNAIKTSLTLLHDCAMSIPTSILTPPKHHAFARQQAKSCWAQTCTIWQPQHSNDQQCVGDG